MTQVTTSDRAATSADVNRATWNGRAVLRWFSRMDGWSDEGERAVVRSVADELRDGRLVDLGVGAGRTVPMMRAISQDYLAVDFASSMVSLCRSLHPDVRVEAGDARSLDGIDSASVDGVFFSWNGIDAVSHGDRADILAEVHRILRSRGLFVFSTHNKAGRGWGETPWSVRRADLAHPRRLAELLFWFPLHVRNHLRHRKARVDGDGWGVANAAAHHFGLVVHYTTLDRQLRELDAAGFETLEVRDNEHGEAVRPGQATADVWWFQIVARRREDLVSAG